jgi:hypothetical protein
LEKKKSIWGNAKIETASKMVIACVKIHPLGRNNFTKRRLKIIKNKQPEAFYPQADVLD